MNSPAEILKQFLIDADIVTDPSDSELWPVFVSFMPDGASVPADAVTLYDTQGVKRGRLMRTGEVIQGEGVQISVRSSTYPIGYAKMKEIEEALDDVKGDTVTVGSDTYSLLNCNRPAAFTHVGVEDNTNRHYFSHNYILTIRQG